MRKFKFKLGSFILASLLSLASTGSAYASGFALIEVNATGQGNAYAGAAANTINASTIFFNPAGMMNLDGEQLVFASHFIEPSAKFKDDGSARTTNLGPFQGDLSDGDSSRLSDDGGDGAFVPNFYWVKPLDEDTSFGVGLNSPFGLKTEYEDDWVGRYHAILSDMKTVNLNPSLGHRVNSKLSIGGGFNLMLAEVDLTSAIDMGAVCLALAGAGACVPNFPNGIVDAETDGLGELDGDNFDDFSWGFNVGLHYMVSNQTSIGVAYRSEIDVEVDGDADFTLPANGVGAIIGGTPLFKDTGLKANVTLPASLSFSIAHKVKKLTWLADVTWTGWSSFDELRIEYDNPDQPDSVTTEDWDDTMRYSVGFDYQATDKLVLRAGIALDETPVPSAERRTPRLPGDDREWISLGLSYLASKRVSIDVGYSHLFIDDADIDNEFESSVPTLTHTLKGEYEAEVDILSAQLNWQLE